MIQRQLIGIMELDDDENLVYTSASTELLYLKQEVYTKIRGWKKIEKNRIYVSGNIIYDKQTPHSSEII